MYVTFIVIIVVFNLESLYGKEFQIKIFSKRYKANQLKC